MRWHSFAREWGNSVALARASLARAGGAAAIALLFLFSGAARADQQKDPELREVVQRTIAQAECFEDRYQSEVWYKMMEPRLRKTVKDHDERMLILKEVICESQRAGEARLPPGLVMAVIHVESRFDHYAVSSAGAVGLMQVMPFWPEQLGLKRHELIRIPQNIRMGCAILRFYLRKEKNSVTRALARYNGSVGRRDYSNLVMAQWTRYNGADDMGLDADTSRAPAVKSAGR
ncbi:MAG: lytic transglycosylase domain-containing protein [Gammaproteobacteria bacterium]